MVDRKSYRGLKSLLLLSPPCSQRQLEMENCLRFWLSSKYLGLPHLLLEFCRPLSNSRLTVYAAFSSKSNQRFYRQQYKIHLRTFYTHSRRITIVLLVLPLLLAPGLTVPFFATAVVIILIKTILLVFLIFPSKEFYSPYSLHPS